MRRIQHSKSSLFLMELLINLLLFCFLCGCGLMFFTKSYNLTQDATALHNAAHLTSSVAGIYETGDGSLDSISKVLSHTEMEGDALCIYYDESFNHCPEKDSTYCILVRELESSLRKISIDFYDRNGLLTYSITACNYVPSTLKQAKEVAKP